jgi:hypothetical protein
MRVVDCPNSDAQTLQLRVQTSHTHVGIKDVSVAVAAAAAAAAVTVSRHRHRRSSMRSGVARGEASVDRHRDITRMQGLK